MGYKRVEIRTPVGEYCAEVEEDVSVGELLKCLHDYGALPRTLGDLEAAFEVAMQGIRLEEGTVIEISDRQRTVGVGEG